MNQYMHSLLSRIKNNVAELWQQLKQNKHLADLICTHLIYMIDPVTRFSELKYVSPSPCDKIVVLIISYLRVWQYIIYQF